jgi:hypothetical protein
VKTAFGFAEVAIFGRRFVEGRALPRSAAREGSRDVSDEAWGVDMTVIVDVTVLMFTLNAREWRRARSLCDVRIRQSAPTRPNQLFSQSDRIPFSPSAPSRRFVEFPSPNAHTSLCFEEGSGKSVSVGAIKIKSSPRGLSHFARDIWQWRRRAPAWRMGRFPVSLIPGVRSMRVIDTP